MSTADETAARRAHHAGLDPERLQRARAWLDDNTDHLEPLADGARGYRLAVARGGKIVVEWNQGVAAATRSPLASASKSLYSNVLGVAVAEGRIGSPDDLVCDYYPEMMDVPADGGPKPGRSPLPKDRAITFRQLISNTSGYMKPGEAPGRVFHYQTFGMNVLTHAVAKAYGLYDVADPEGSPGFGVLVDRHIAQPLGIQPTYTLTNFPLPASARLPVFGYYCQIWVDVREAVALSWLWQNRGSWNGKQVVPQGWMDESVRVAAPIRAHCPRDQWCYGHGFWTNETGVLWPQLPRSGFTASGAGGRYLTVFPEQDLIVVQLPGPVHQRADGDTAQANPELLGLVLDALTD